MKAVRFVVENILNFIGQCNLSCESDQSSVFFIGKSKSIYDKNTEQPRAPYAAIITFID